MKHSLFTLAFFMGTYLFHAVAQDVKQVTVSGYVYDSISRETLIGANIYHHDLRRGAVSNSYGFYSISLPPGETTMAVSYVGYAPHEKQMTLRKDTVVHWLLETAELQEVTVEARRNAPVAHTQLGAVSLPPALVRSLPAILGEVDLVKVLQQTPGVSAGTEGFSGLYVRGGNKDENLYLIDGNPVYDVNHLFGFFSTFNADALKSADFYKGSFPARFGGRLSSVVDIRMKDGDMQEYHGLFTLGLVSSKLQLEGPLIRNRASFSVAVRRTYLDVLTTPALWIANAQMEGEKNHGGYYFYDLNAKLNYKFSDRSRIYLNAYSGEDALRIRQEWAMYADSRSENGARWNWGNRLASLNWNYVFTPQLFANISVLYSHFHSRIRLYEWEKNMTEGQTVGQRSMDRRYHSGIEDVGFRTDFDWTPHPNHYIRFGSNYLFHTFRPEENGTTASYSHDGVAAGDTLRFRNDPVRAHEGSVYVEDDFSLSARLKVNAGLHLSVFRVEGKTYAGLQPRVSARFLFDENLSAKAAYARMQQYVHLLSASTVSLPSDLWVPVTKNIRPMHANQYSAGLFYNLNRTYDFSIEAYYKTMEHLIEYRDDASLMSSVVGWQDRVASGTGTARGLELMVQRTAGRLTGWAGYGLSWTDRRFPGGEINGGQRYPAKYDNRHKINLAANYKLNDKIELNGGWTYYSGNRMTAALEHYEMPSLLPGERLPDAGAYPYPNETPHYGARNNYRMSDYHRLDIGVNIYRPKKKGRMAIWNLGVYNAYCRLNPMLAWPGEKTVTDAQGQSQVKAIMTEYSLFPVIPSFSYTYKF